jgi:lysophospholipase L1-like esterase
MFLQHPPRRPAPGRTGAVSLPQPLKLLVRLVSYLFLSACLLAGGVWALLGNLAIRPMPQHGAHWLAAHQAIADRLKQGHARLLYIGDSIVERLADPGQAVWDKYYAPRDAVNMGIAGDKTQHVLWRLDHCNLEAVHPDLAIVMIGQNNDHWSTADQIADGVKAIVFKLEKSQPQMKVLLLGIFYRGEKPGGERLRLDKTNAEIAELADDTRVWYLNVNRIFLNPDGTISRKLMPDCEHPSEEGCRVWAQAIEPKVAELLGEKPIPP